MASGTISLSNYGSSTIYQARISWSSSTNVANNYSTITAKLQVRCTASLTQTFTFSNFIECGFSYSDSALKTVENTKTVSFGSSWTTVTTLTTSPYHKSDGTRTMYLGATLISGKDASGNTIINATTGGRAPITLDKIPRGASVTAAPNFNDEENPTMTYSNPAGSNVTSLQACISLTGSADDIAYRDISKTGTSYTFELTEAERNVLRNATLSGSNTRTVYFYLKTVISGNTYYSNVAKTLTIVNATPSISPTVYDVDATTVALTKNSDVFIRGYSDLQYQMTATPKKGASISSYAVTCGSKSANTATGTFTDANADKVVLTATDNRGLTGTYEWPIEVVEYFPITCNFKAGEITLDTGDGTTATAKVSIDGTFFNSTFGADGVANELVIEVKHTGTNDEWVTLTDGLVPIVNGNKYSLDITVRGLNYRVPITFQCRAMDKLTSATTGEQTLHLVPIFDWSDEDFNFNVPVNMNGETVLRHNATANNLVVSASGGFIYFRPGGTSDTSSEVKINPQGNIELAGDIIIDGKSLKSLLGI